VVRRLLLALERLFLSTSLDRARRIGAFLGLVWFHVVRIRRPTAIRQIARSLGVSPPVARAIARETWRNLGRSAAEFFRLEEAARTVRTRGWERYLAAKARGKGVVVVTAHFGNWDLCAASQALRGEPLHVVTKDLSDRGVNALWMERRRQAGVRLHAARGSLRPLLEALRGGETVGLVVDQHAPGGPIVPFFGRGAATSSSSVVLATRTGAALLPAFLFRDHDGRGHELRIGEEIPVTDVRSTLARIHGTLEDAIRERPDHWLWLHRRWKVSEGYGAVVAGAADPGAAVPGAAVPPAVDGSG
jgi:KDO2-lipid IV(A) lauroyltransferase